MGVQVTCLHLKKKVFAQNNKITKEQKTFILTELYHDDPSHIFSSEQKSIRLGDVSVIETNDVLQMKVAISTQDFVKICVVYFDQRLGAAHFKRWSK